MSTNQVDARGLACPQPVIATKKALDGLREGVLTTIVDNAVAKENVLKFATANGCGAAVEEKDGCYYITITKGCGTQSATAQPAGAVVLLTRDTLGHGSDELGAVLMKAYFTTLVEAKPWPRRIFMLNSGVKLAVSGSPVLSHLQELVAGGVDVMSCGTCVDYFHLKDQVAVGGVTNMYTIQEELARAPKVVTL